jgi:hypothetical protein
MTPEAAAESVQTRCAFDRVYEFRQTPQLDRQVVERDSVLDSLRKKDDHGLIRTPTGTFQIERGELATSGAESLWSLSTADYSNWMAKIAQNQRGTFDDVAKIRVGIKTTADEVFLREDWTTLPASIQPERCLIRPLIRHFDAVRWLPGTFSQSVLYPYEEMDGKRRPVDLSRYPCSNAYFTQHRDRLNQRQYLIDAGRAWYEIWVPHSPGEWSGPKIVYPDIAVEPRFFLDRSGAVVNGDCYWITLRESVDESMLLVMMAVANSTLIKKFYDIAFHNKLYSGRRRYMTQYVKKFPLPDRQSRWCRAIIDRLAPVWDGQHLTTQQDQQLDDLVWKAFGMIKDA